MEGASWPLPAHSPCNFAQTLLSIVRAPLLVTYREASELGEVESWHCWLAQCYLFWLWLFPLFSIPAWLILVMGDSPLQSLRLGTDTVCG